MLGNVSDAVKQSYIDPLIDRMEAEYRRKPGPAARLMPVLKVASWSPGYSRGYWLAVPGCRKVARY
ncbi:hypothetical protein WDV93_23585 [Pantoea ananatis]